MSYIGTIKSLLQSMKVSESISGIYRIISPSGRIYIGKSVNFRQRLIGYNSLKCEGQTFLYNSFIKHSIDNHLFELIHECPIDELSKWEYFYLILYVNSGLELGEDLLNLRIEPQDSCKGILSEETKRKIGFANSNPSEKTRKKLSEANTGEKNPMYGRKGKDSPSFGIKRTEEQKIKMRERVISEKQKKQISKTLTGKKQSEETKQKRKDSISILKWYNNGIINKRCIPEEKPEGWIDGRFYIASEETRKKLSDRTTEYHKRNKINEIV